MVSFGKFSLNLRRFHMLSGQQVIHLSLPSQTADFEEDACHSIYYILPFNLCLLAPLSTVNRPPILLARGVA